MAALQPTVDLSNCDREPIHIPGSVQPHGFLLVVDPGTQGLVQVAGSPVHFAGNPGEALLGSTIADVLGAQATLLIERPMSSEPSFLGSFPRAGKGSRVLDMTAHLRDDVLILELEPRVEPARGAAEVLGDVRTGLSKMQAATDVNHLLQVAAGEGRRLTGFDRVMSYKFLEGGAGAVVAEARDERLEPFLNHHYPASDIPQQARALYLRNVIRVIPDVSYTPAPLQPSLNPKTGAPLDMTDCALRSVSPIHVQYLKNMGVSASMSVSIIVDGALWGLIAFHHELAKLVPYEMREVCKHLGQILAQQIKTREEAALHHQTLRLASARDAILAVLTKAGSLQEGLLNDVKDIQRVVRADGAAVVAGEAIVSTGYAPDHERVRELATWLNTHQSRTFHTTSLVTQYSGAEAYGPEASGLLATIVSREEPIVLLWFRGERIRTIDWAGNPHKPVDETTPGQLTPRKSFETWKETVRNQAEPWSPAEVEAAGRLCRALSDLRQQQSLAKLNTELQRALAEKELLLTQKGLLMQEVNHRVQNSLQLVNSMLHLQSRQAGDDQVRAHFDEASRRIMAISAVHRRLWRSDHIQSVEFGSYLEELRDGLVEAWGSAWAGQIRVNADHVLVPTNQAVVLALVVTELLTNAVKYAYEGRPGRVDVRLKEDRNAIRVVVRDRGVGIGEGTPQSGLGSRLIRSLISQLQGELKITEEQPGTAVTLIVPVVTNPTA